MFEELNQHRAAVAEQIQKAMEIGFTGNELEKAHKVGDIHPNGKWVWTQLPSGKYDWRVIKKTGAPSGGSAPAAAQKTAQSGKVELPGIGKELFYESKKEPGKLIKVVGLEPDVFAFKKMVNGAWVKTGESRTENAKKILENYTLKKEGITENKRDATTKNSDIQQQTSAGKKETAEEEAKKESDYEIGGKVTSKNFDSFAKLVNSKKNNFYIADTVGGRRHRGGRITSVASDSTGNVKIRIHWMGNGENEKKEFYSKDKAAYWLNGLDFDVEEAKKKTGDVKSGMKPKELDEAVDSNDNIKINKSHIQDIQKLLKHQDIYKIRISETSPKYINFDVISFDPLRRKYKYRGYLYDKRTGKMSDLQLTSAAYDTSQQAERYAQFGRADAASVIDRKTGKKIIPWNDWSNPDDLKA